MAEITLAGYKLKSQNEWFAEEVALYRGIDPAWDLDPSSPDGLKSAHDAEIFYALDENGLRAYNSKDPEKARGIELDIICAISGVYRLQGTRSDVTIRFYGNPGAFVLTGAIVESATTGERWYIEQTYTVLPVGYVDVTAYSPEVGPTSADVNTLTKIVTVMSGITSCTNLTPALLGLDAENDSALRIRRRKMVGKPSNNQLDSMYSAIVETKDVRRVAVYNNPTGSAAVSTRNPHGLPAHSIAAVVDGGDDLDVATSIYYKLNPGPELVSVATTVIEVVQSPTRTSHQETIIFSRPTYVNIVLNIQIVGSDYPSDIAQQVKDAVMDYAIGSLIDPSVGFRSTGFGIGDDVPYSSLFTPINKIIGPYNGYVQTLSVNGGTANIPIAFNQLSRWDEANITVTVV